MYNLPVLFVLTIFQMNWLSEVMGWVEISRNVSLKILQVRWVFFDVESTSLAGCHHYRKCDLVHNVADHFAQRSVSLICPVTLGKLLVLSSRVSLSIIRQTTQSFMNRCP